MIRSIKKNSTHPAQAKSILPLPEAFPWPPSWRKVRAVSLDPRPFYQYLRRCYRAASRSGAPSPWCGGCWARGELNTPLGRGAEAQGFEVSILPRVLPSWLEAGCHLRS